jgi:hypothetical protein
MNKTRRRVKVESSLEECARISSGKEEILVSGRKHPHC